jgi:small multidrug resistance pump
MMSWAWLVAAIIAELGATLSLRASDGFRKRLWLLPLTIGYALAFMFLALALNAGMHVGVAYGIWAAAGISLIALLARAIWKDPLTKRMVLGIVVIAAGVILVEVG